MILKPKDAVETCAAGFGCRNVQTQICRLWASGRTNPKALNLLSFPQYAKRQLEAIVDKSCFAARGKNGLVKLLTGCLEGT